MPSAGAPCPFEEHVCDACGANQGRRDDDRVEWLVGEVGPFAADSGGQPVVGELAQHTGFGDRVVGTAGHDRPQHALPRVHPVGGQQDQPVRGAPSLYFRYAYSTATAFAAVRAR